MTNKKERQVWILGGTGYIGSALRDHLSQAGGQKLHLLLHHRTAEHIQEAHNCFQASLAEIDPIWFERYPPDVVFHLARPAGRHPLTRWYRSLQGQQANSRLAGMLAALPKPPMVVYVSGSLMYGSLPEGFLANEQQPLRPDAYAEAYFRNEKPWLEAGRNGILDIRFARPGWILGPDSWFERFFWQAYLRTGKVPCYGDGKQWMSIVSLKNCALLVDALSRYGSPGQVLNVFGMPPLRQESFSESLAGLLGSGVERVPMDRLQKQEGPTTARALTLSIPMESQYPEIYANAGVEEEKLAHLLSDTIRLLKDKEAVFPKSP
jgi:nucleoside-diphosphate-sugar epimerase